MVKKTASDGGESGGSAGAASSDSASGAEPTDSSPVNRALEWMHHLPSTCVCACDYGRPAALLVEPAILFCS